MLGSVRCRKLIRPPCVPASTTVRQVYSAHFQRALEEQDPERETGGAPEADTEHSAAAHAGAAAAEASLAEHAAVGEPARIPLVLHQIWRGSPLPPRFAALRARWRALHPRWRHVLWTDTEIDAEHARVAPRPSARAAPAAADFATATLPPPPPLPA
jgi:mannosyltransferase OCH1-like enzyme